MSEIILSVLRCPDAVVPEQRRAAGGEISLGRGADCDWQLADPERVLSKKHCVLEFFGGGWQVRDTSSNGTFVNHAAAPVGRDQVKPLFDGDRLRLGAYEIEVRILDAAAPGAGPGWGTGDPAPPGFGGTPLPGAATPVSSRGASLLPDDFDPFADDRPPMPDHAPSTAEAFMVPPSLPAGKALIPEDWDLEPTPRAAPPRPATPPPAAPRDPFGAPPPATRDPFGTPAPVARDPFGTPPPVARDPFGTPPPVARDPFGAPPAGPDPFAAPPAPPPPPARDPFAAPSPFAEHGDPSMPPRAVPVAMVPPGGAPATPVAPPAALPPASAAPPLAAAAALAALLEGAGLPPGAAARAQQDPEAALRAAGSVLRAAVAGIRALLIARADIKREFRIEQTMLRAANNNPLKFAATDEMAVAALLDPRTPALAAVQETVGDLTAHQVAALAATQAAARALLDRLSPAPIEAEDKGGLFAGSKEKRLWEAYKRRHAQLVEQFEDDFDSAFGKAFARAYEQATGRRED